MRTRHTGPMSGHAPGSRPSAPADPPAPVATRADPAPARPGGPHAPEPTLGLSEADGTFLARYAARAVGAALAGTARDGRPPTSAALRREGATFVSLHRDGELRGCI